MKSSVVKEREWIEIIRLSRVPPFFRTFSLSLSLSLHPFLFFNWSSFGRVLWFSSLYILMTATGKLNKHQINLYGTAVVVVVVAASVTVIVAVLEFVVAVVAMSLLLFLKLPFFIIRLIFPLLSVKMLRPLLPILIILLSLLRQSS